MAQNMRQNVQVLDNQRVLNFSYHGRVLRAGVVLYAHPDGPYSYRIQTPNPRISILQPVGLVYPPELLIDFTWEPNEMDVFGDLNSVFVQRMHLNIHAGTAFIELPGLEIDEGDIQLRCILPPIVIAANPNVEVDEEEMVPQLEEAVDAGRRVLPPIVIPENGNGAEMVPQLEVVNDLDYSVADIVNNVDIPALEGITDLFLRKFLIKKGFTAMEDSALIEGFRRLHRFLENTLGQSFGMEFLSLPRFLRRYYGEAVDRQPFPNFGTFLPSLKETQNRQYIVVFFKNRPHLDERKMNKYLDKLSKY